MTNGYFKMTSNIIDNNNNNNHYNHKNDKKNIENYIEKAQQIYSDACMKKKILQNI